MRQGKLGGPSREQIEPFVESGHVRSSTNGTLTIYSYTDLCVYDRVWNDVTTHCRGLILDNATGARIAAPFRKFFNLGEPSCPALPDAPYEVFEKLDGSLIIAYFYAGEWRFATRGSLDNIYTTWASRWVDAMEHMDIGYTHMFEVVLPKGSDPMPRAVPHQASLSYLGSVFTSTWDEAIDDTRHRDTWGMACGSVARSFGAPQIEHLLKRAEEETGHEGWVIRYEDGTRVKIKTAWYLKVFRALNNLTPKKLRELLAESLDPEGTIASFPEELRPEVESIVWPIINKAQAEGLKVYRTFHKELNQLYPRAATDRDQRKAFALHTKELPHRALYFKLLEGKEIMRDLILQE